MKIAPTVSISPEFCTDIEPAISQAICDWRNSLFCMAESIPRMYLALEDKILVYDMYDVMTKDTISPIHIASNPHAEAPKRRRYGAQPGPFDGPAINILQTFMLGHQEVLVSGDGLGRVILRYVNDLNQPPICYNLGSSIWGLDIKQRTLVASANSHHVYLIDLQSAPVAAEFNKQKEHITILVGAHGNIPSVSLSNDGDWVACLDITGAVTLWDPHLPDTAPLQTDLPDLMEGWGCCLISPQAFRNVKGDNFNGSLGNLENLVRSLHPKLSWWEAVGVRVVPRLDPEGENESCSFRSIPPNLHLLDSFECCWRTEEMDTFSRYMPMHAGEADESLLLLTSHECIYLVHLSDVHELSALCHYPFGPDFILEHDLERINMLRALPQCGFVVVGTQRGQVCLLELIKSVVSFEGHECASFSFLCHDLDDAGHVYGEDDSIVGLDVKQVTPGEARVSILHRTGRLRVKKILIDGKGNELEIVDLKL